MELNEDDRRLIRGPNRDEVITTPGFMYQEGYKCVEKSGDIWTWVYKPASTTPPAKRGRPKKTE